MYIYVYLHTYVYIYICIYRYLCIYLCIYIYIFIYIYIYIYINIYIYIYICKCICLDLFVYVCMYVCVFIYIYIHVYINARLLGLERLGSLRGGSRTLGYPAACSHRSEPCHAACRSLYRYIACGRAVGCGVCDTPELWRGAAGLCARVRACAGAAESLQLYIHTCIRVWNRGPWATQRLVRPEACHVECCM